MAVKVWIVTGWRGSGKTTFCRQAVGTARQMGWRPAGLLSPAVFENGQKTSIWAEDIQSSQKCLLAAITPQTDADLAFGDWYFSQETLTWGNRVLQSSLPCDLLLIDELGPLEFNLGLGWVSALDLIQSGQYRQALVVIRPELLAKAQEILNTPLTIEINHVNEVQEKVRSFASVLNLLNGVS